MKEKEILINQTDLDNMIIDEQPQIDQRRSSVYSSDLRRRVDNRASRRRNPRSQINARKKRIMRICVILSALLILAMIVWGVSNIGFNSEDDPNILVDDIVEDKVSVLLVGTDGGGYNTDTLMLALMDCKNHTLNLMSIPRDTRVPNPYGGKGYSKINSVYTAKGMSGLINQIGEITGLPINFYIKVDFKGFREIIDELGGVQFDVPMRLKYSDPEQNLYIDLQKGPQLLDGEKAEQLVRARSQYAQADIKRTEIQREFVKETIKQHAVASNLLKVGDLYNIMSKYVTTNITLGDAVKYAPSLTKVSDENIQMFILPGTTGGEITSYWLYDAKQMEELAHNVFWYDVKIKPTPRPSFKPAVTSTPEPSPSASPELPGEDDENPSVTSKPSSSASPKPTSSAKPTKSPSPTPSVRPTKTPTPTPVSTPSATPTPPQSYNPGEYPDGI